MNKQITNFKAGMTPFINGDGIYRIEHFDVTTNQARPYNELIASSIVAGYNQVSKFWVQTGTLFCLADGDASNPPNNYLAILRWDDATQAWVLHEQMTETAVYAKTMIYYNGYFTGLWKGTHLWRISQGDVQKTFAARSYTNTTDFIIHSKDNILYIPTDNKINTLNLAVYSADALTLPTDFRITSICERGENILISGFNTKGGRSTNYIWDKDSTLIGMTGIYDLGLENVWHNATLSGTSFSISSKDDSDNSSFSEKPRLIIRYLNGDNFEILNEYQFNSLSIGGKFIDNNKLYFNASFMALNETDRHWVVFCLDDKGKLSIAQNVGTNDGGSLNALPGIIRDGDGFWIGGYTDGTWNSTDTNNTLAIIETTKYSSKDLTKGLDTIGITIDCEPLAVGQYVIIKKRQDAETDWTTVGTLNTVGDLGGAVTGQDIPTASNIQFRLESLGATINVCQFDFEEINNGIYDR